ncbi:MAG: DUF3794 domain-containing protein [Oscillospiraceae bacterium]|nr:DUF3794 domain-containing protein [Oscillospiraceae bacterium]
MQFETKQVSCLQPLKRQLQSAEETAEIRLSDGMPEIGTVLGAWGQMILRSKEWNGDSIGLHCGVMAWVLYLPEEGEGVYSVQTWIPVQLRWDLPPADRDGNIQTCCAIRQLDARSTSSRRIMVRAVVDAVAEAWVPAQTPIPVPGAYPGDVQVLTETYPILLPKEAGEKSFQLEENLTMPASIPKPEKIMYYRLHPEVTDQKVMAGRAVFRGCGHFHMVYRTEDGRICSWDTEVPFSQYMDLDGSFEQDARIGIQPCVTSLDLEMNPDGTMLLNAGLLAQFLLWDQEMITVAQDAYSPERTVVPLYGEVYLPAVLDSKTQLLRAEKNLPEELAQVADVVFYPGCGCWEHKENEAQLNLTGFFRLLGYDGEHRLCSRTVLWDDRFGMPADASTRMHWWVNTSKAAQAMSVIGGVDLRADIQVDSTVYTGQDLRIMTGMELEDATEKDPNRPSLILCRKGNRRLWDVAKETGSTVAAIESANHLTGEPDGERILLIPIQ